MTIPPHRLGELLKRTRHEAMRPNLSRNAVGIRDQSEKVRIGKEFEDRLEDGLSAPQLLLTAVVGFAAVLNYGQWIGVFNDVALLPRRTPLLPLLLRSCSMFTLVHCAR